MFGQIIDNVTETVNNTVEAAPNLNAADLLDEFSTVVTNSGAEKTNTSAVEELLSDPVGGVKDMLDGVNSGFELFGENLSEHLIQGAAEWDENGNIMGTLHGVFNESIQEHNEDKEYWLDNLRESLVTDAVGDGLEQAIEIFNPAGAIVETVETIYNVDMWFINNAEKMVNLVDAVGHGIVGVAAEGFESIINQ